MKSSDQKAQVRRPLTGPQAWVGRDLATSDSWIWPLSPADLTEIDTALRRVEGRPWRDIRRDHFPLPGLSVRLAAAAEELESGRGLVTLRGLPVEAYDGEQLRRIFSGIGSHLGTPVSQSVGGEMMAEIRAEAGDVGARRGRLDPDAGGEAFLSSRARVHTSGGLRFHTDRTDVVALLCVRQAASGGVSKVVSAVAIHNTMLARRPDLLELLFADYPRSRFGEESTGIDDYYQLPVFALRGGHFTSHYSRTYIEAAQRMPAAPKLTSEQWQAMDLLHALGDELCFETVLRPGDMQFLNNHVIYHAREPYEDGADTGLGRLLYRLWLSVPNSRPLPKTHRVLWGATDAGALRGGIWPPASPAAG